MPNGRDVQFSNTLVNVNAALAGLQYIPDTYECDLTWPGVENITVLADDLGHFGDTTRWGTKTTYTMPIHVTPVNNAPVIYIPAYLYTDEDVPFQGLNITVTDVDSFYNITINISASYGVLSCSPCIRNLTANSTIKFTANLLEIADIISKIIYKSNQYYNGIDTLTINADDGNSFNSTAVTRHLEILIDAVNNPPAFTLTCPTLCTGGENYTQPANLPVVTTSPLVYSNSNNAPSISVFDPDSGTLWIQLLISAGKGTIKLGSSAGIAEVDIPKNASASYLSTCTVCPSLILIMAPQSVINTVLTGLTYYRNTSGTDMLIVAVNDLQHTGKGKAGTDVVVFNIY
jgi:hypothetical protein